MMDELSTEIGVGIFASLIGAFTLMLRWATERFGKPATNQALDLASKSMSLFDKLTDAIEELKDAATSMNQEIITSRTESSKEHSGLMEVINAFHIANSKEHKTALDAIHNIPSQIIPKIEELTQAQAAKMLQSEGLEKVMDKAIVNQEKTLTEILGAVRRIEAGFAEFKKDNAENLEKFEKFEQDVEIIKADLDKVMPPVATANQPIVTPEPTHKITELPKPIESKDETK